MKIGPFLNFHDRILLFASPKPQCVAWHVLLTAGLSPAMLNKKHVRLFLAVGNGWKLQAFIQEFFKTCRSKRPQAACHLLVVWLGHAELSNAEVVSLYEARADNGIIGAVAQRCIEPNFC